MKEEEEEKEEGGRRSWRIRGGRRKGNRNRRRRRRGSRRRRWRRGGGLFVPGSRNHGVLRESSVTESSRQAPVIPPERRMRGRKGRLVREQHAETRA